MSAALITRAPSMTSALAPTRTVSPLATFPIGARFPRRCAQELAAGGYERDVQIASSPVFPIGARFARRTPADVVLYLAELAVGGGRLSSTHRIYPVGARFPRR